MFKSKMHQWVHSPCSSAVQSQTGPPKLKEAHRQPPHSLEASFSRALWEIPELRASSRVLFTNLTTTETHDNTSRRRKVVTVYTELNPRDESWHSEEERTMSLVPKTKRTSSQTREFTLKHHLLTTGQLVVTHKHLTGLFNFVSAKTKCLRSSGGKIC